MDATAYKFLLWELIAALDTGKFDNLSIEDVRHHARAGASAKFLQSTFGKFGMLKDEDWKAIDVDFQNMDNAIDARRKFGVEYRGISLLMAWTLQGLQSKQAER